MADYNLKAEITADASGFESGVKKAEKASKKLSTTVSGVIKGLGKNGLVGALGAVGLASSGLSATLGSVVKIARKVSETMNECTNAYKNQLIAERSLDTAIQNNPFITGASADALKQFASEMQKVSNYGDEELIPMMTNLVSLGRTESETMKIMSVAMDMSAGMGISLDTAITQLNATLNGNIGRLGQQNAELKDLTEEELKQGKAIEILGEKFKGLSSATADTSKQLQNIKGDFKEALGQFTLPSSDMWNKFWAGFYEQGIKVLEGIDKKINELTIGKTLAGAMTGQLGKLSYTGDRIEYLRDAFAMISDEELEAVTDYLSSLSRVNEEQKQILERAELEKQRRIDIQKIEKQMAEESAKRKKEKEEEAELENGIALLKDKHIQKLKEQEAKWENIKKVTGQEVALEEKIKFYQDDLVAIMTEAGGQITTNNQYYKDQIELINNLKSQIGEVAEVTEEVIEEVEEANFSDFFADLSKGITVVIANAKKGLYDVEAETRKAKDTIINDFAKIVSNAFGDIFTKLGENLAGAGHGFEDFASVALKALSEVLKSISAQLSALAVLKALTHNYAEATVALAGATASMVASGVANQVSKNLTTTKTKIDAVGDSANKAGKDLEYFIKRLEEIKSGMTSSSRNLVANITELKKGWQEAKKTADEAYEAYDKARKELESNEEYQRYLAYEKATRRKSLASFFIRAFEEPVEELEKKYQDLSEVEKQYYKEFSEASKNVLNDIKAEVEGNKTLIQSYKDIYQSLQQYQYEQLEQYKTYVDILLNEQKLSVQKLLTDVYDQLASTGKSIGDKLVNSIINGAEKKDFLKEMKSYIRENLIKIAVYTETFQDKLAEVGMKLSASLTGAFSLSEVRSEIEDLYETATKNAENAEKVIADVFGDIQDTVNKTTEETVNGFEDMTSTFEELLKSFGETIADVGGEIGTQFVDAISEGMNQGDFLQKMKGWIKKMLVQSVVYTESMKSEIEAIGQAITKGIREGFTETSLHEIRRDLSWVFNEANKTVSSLDDILDKTFGGYAIGTNNAVGGLHLVGEAGPELVKFRGGEQVLNTNNTQKALSGMGGTTINQNVTFNNLRDTTAYAMMNQFKQYNRSLAINGVI